MFIDYIYLILAWNDAQTFLHEVSQIIASLDGTSFLLSTGKVYFVSAILKVFKSNIITLKFAGTAYQFCHILTDTRSSEVHTCTSLWHLPQCQITHGILLTNTLYLSGAGFSPRMCSDFPCCTISGNTAQTERGRVPWSRAKRWNLRRSLWCRDYGLGHVQHSMFLQNRSN